MFNEVERHPFNFMFLSVKPLLQCGAILLLLCVGACANRNINMIEASELVLSSRFAHRVIPQRQFHDEFTFTVYIPGDGQPWSEAGIMRDPSPSYSLGFELMRASEGSGAFVARPCYYGAWNKHCNPGLWTSGRYSEELLISYQQVIEQLLDEHRAESLTLVGYSGGGQIASLLAARMPQTRRLITLAANLDHKAWTRRHGYSPLWDSENAADVRLPEHIEQYHFAGAEDDNVPVELSKEFFTRNGLSPIILPKFDHQCCWLQFWRKHHLALLNGNPKPEDFLPQ